MNDARVLDVLVIGAGQAGLATGYHLRTTGLRYELIDVHTRVGDSWRSRPDSPRSHGHAPQYRKISGTGSVDEIRDRLFAALDS